ncbi:MAG: cache domain-containing protein [Desulfobacterales bacterium]
MLILKQWRLMIAFPAFLLMMAILISGCKIQYEDLNLTMYQYRDTKNLVKFVYDASLILKKDGLKSLDYFRNNRARFRTPEYYLYIYDIKGTNIFHAGMEHLEGKNLWDVTDKNGKKAVQFIVAALEDRNNPHAWVHYSWWEPGKFYPVPKSSCHFKVRTPEGEELFVGGGIDYPHEEKEFIRIIVDDAAQLIERKGWKALDDISNPVSKYNYRDVRVFAFHQDGELLISPAVADTIFQTNLLDCTDEVGHKPFAKAIKELESQDRVWEVFIAKNRYKREPIKKSLYIRKTMIDGSAIYFAAITDLPEPPY